MCDDAPFFVEKDTYYEVPELFIVVKNKSLRRKKATTSRRMLSYFVNSNC